MAKARPRCIVIAGPNGAGKTTFAREFLPKDRGWRNFEAAYRHLVDSWAVYDNQGRLPKLIAQSDG